MKVKTMKRQEIEDMRAAGWRFVSEHRAVATADARARVELRKMMQRNKVLPEVKIVPLSRETKTRLLFRRWRR